jgi:hypothetical protein
LLAVIALPCEQTIGEEQLCGIVHNGMLDAGAQV